MSYVKDQLALAAAEGEPKLPTYRTIADVLEKKNGSGIRLAGWTVARTFLIMPGMLAVGVSPKKAFVGSILSSSLISMLALIRIYNAGFAEDAERWARMKRAQKLERWERRQAPAALGSGWERRRQRQAGRYEQHRARIQARHLRRRQQQR
jgi:hypothetical protein